MNNQSDQSPTILVLGFGSQHGEYVKHSDYAAIAERLEIAERDLAAAHEDVARLREELARTIAHHNQTYRPIERRC